MAWALAYWFVFASDASGAGNFYVDRSDPACSDAGPGSSGQPYCTIGAAVAARQGAGTTITVRPGTYREQIDLAVSGAANSPFIIEAAGSVILDGAEDFAAPEKWILHAGNVWLAASVTWDPAQMFADSTRLNASTAAADSLAPGTFRYVAGVGLYANVGGGNPGNHAAQVGKRLYGFRATGRGWIRIEGFTITRSGDKGIYLRNGAHDITVARNTIQFSNGFGIHAAGCTGITIDSNTVSDNRNHGIGLTLATTGSVVQGNESFRNARVTVIGANGLYLFDAPNNVIRGNRLHHNEDSGVHIQSSSGNVLQQNVSWSNGDKGFGLLSAPGTVHVGDVAWGNESSGFSVEGSSTGTHMHNCLAANNGSGSSEFALMVDGTSMNGFESDDNVFWAPGGPGVIRYNSIIYQTVADFSNATGFDTRSFQADPRFVDPSGGDYRLRTGSPAIDAGNSAVDQWPATDAAGRARVDDPGSPNLGMGAVAYADRGAYEAWPPAAALTALPNSGPAPLQVVADASPSTDVDGRVVTYRFDFGDGTIVEGASAIVSHVYVEGTWNATLRVTDDGGFQDTAQVTVVVTAGNRVPVVSAPAGAATREDSTLSIDVTAADPDGEAIGSLTADLTNLPPGNATFIVEAGNGAGTLTWRPSFADSGSYLVSFTATNSLSGTASTLIHVTNVDRVPHVIAPPWREDEVNRRIDISVSASDPDGDPIVSLVADLSALPQPNNATFVPGPANATGLFSWTPAVGDTGTYDVTFTATNALSHSAVTSIRVVPVPPFVPADEIHWTFTGPTSVTINWRGSQKSVRYGLTENYGLSVQGVTPNPLPFSSPGPFWEARLTGLVEDTLYHYTIAGGTDHTFRTPRTRGSSDFLVCATGDVGERYSYTPMPILQAQIAADSPAFCLVVGDLTYANAHGQAAVDQHFNDVMVWSRNAAYMPTWGNHEWDDPEFDDLRNYKGRFDLPNPQTSPGSPEVSCCGEDWYWFDYGNVRFIAIPEPWAGAFADWCTKATALMDEAEEDPAITFVVTMGHRPAYSSGHHLGHQTLRACLDALGAAHPKYVLDLSGHSHNYERTVPLNGVVHVVVGNGGSNLQVDPSGGCVWRGGCPPPAWSAYRAVHHGYLRLHFGQTEIRGVAVCGPLSGDEVEDITCSLGSIMDEFTISAPHAVDVAGGPSMGGLGLAPGYPNPFDRQATVRYTLPRDLPVFLGVFDLSGTRVATLVDGMRPAGQHAAMWNGQTATGARARSGVYFVMMKVGGVQIARKLVLAR